MELTMMTASNLRRNLAVAGALAVFAFGGALEATAETDIYRDIRMPQGHARGMAAKRADIRACGAVNGAVRDEDFGRADQCMRAHGWVVDHVVPDPPPAEEKGTVVHFDDMRQRPNGSWRGDTVLQADTRRCAKIDAEYESSEFKQCMLGRGWRFAYTHQGPGGSQARGKTWQEIDDSGVLVTCRSILGGFGSVCTNF
jgi:hypothetical protein